MVFIEQGYYSGLSEFTDGMTFGSQVEFTVPPLFNSDTAGFAVIKSGDRRVQVTFDNPYIAQPVVNATLSFESNDNITDSDADALFASGVQSLVVNKSQTGFTILLSKNAPRDLRFSWNALAVRDAKIYESIFEGLTFTAPVDTTPDTSSSDSVPPVPVEPSASESDPNPSSDDSGSSTLTPDVIPDTSSDDSVPPAPEIIPETPPAPDASTVPEVGSIPASDPTPAPDTSSDSVPSATDTAPTE